MLASTVNKTPFGFNIIGFATANLGLGVALRNTVALLEQAGFSFCVLDIDPGGNRTGHDHATQKYNIQAGQVLPYNVNIFFMNPPAVESLLINLPDLIETKGKFNVNISFWELPNLPKTWKPILEIMDLVLAPSKFIQVAIEAVLTQTPCRYYQQALPNLPAAKPNRSRWGFAPGRTIFLFSFDISSGIQKKNPLAVLEAFKQAFSNGEANLVLKVNNRGVAPEAGIVTERLKAAALQVPGVRVLDETMPYADVMSLYASADVFVSLHRAEGLGLSLMEFMALGKPVIATAWSGNMDFMDAENSCLVPYTLIPLDPNTQYHAISQGVSQVWAEPDLNAAIEWMVRLDKSPELRAEIGQKAKASMEKLRETVAKADVFKEIQAMAGKSGCA
jgi:glycosyltransferase involved in cell wall biosynthesis